MRERRERGRGKDDEGEGRLERNGSNLHRTRAPEGQPAWPASFSPAASSRGSRGGGRKGFPVQEAAQAAAASSLTLLSPAPPISHSPRRRVPAPPPADPPTASARPSVLRALALSPPPWGPLIHSLAAGPARRGRGGSGPGQGPKRGGPLHTSLPHLGAAEPLAPAAPSVPAPRSLPVRNGEGREYWPSSRRRRRRHHHHSRCASAAAAAA